MQVQITSARKVKESSGGGYKIFKGIGKGIKAYHYEVIFDDGKTYTSNTEYEHPEFGHKVEFDKKQQIEDAIRWHEKQVERDNLNKIDTVNNKLQYFNKKLLTLSLNEMAFHRQVSLNPLQFTKFQQIIKYSQKYNLSLRQIRELTELAYIYYFKNIIRDLDKAGGMAAFNKIVADYEKLPTLTTRTSTIVDLAQYSTPSPISYLMGEFGGEVETVFDPTAGNGMLFLNVKAKEKYGNEISLYRLKNLNYQGIKTTYFDATKEFPEEYKQKFDFIVTNPPFGTFPPIKFDKYEITSLEHYIVLKALETMKPTGKAAIIVGSNVEYDTNGIIKPGKFRQFLFYLYSKYNVVDVLNCSGELYYKMGTSFPITIIFIKGITHNPQYPTRVDFDLSTGTTNSPNQIQHFEAVKSRVEGLLS